MANISFLLSASLSEPHTGGSFISIWKTYFHQLLWLEKIRSPKKQPTIMRGGCFRFSSPQSQFCRPSRLLEINEDFDGIMVGDVGDAVIAVKGAETLH